MAPAHWATRYGALKNREAVVDVLAKAMKQAGVQRTRDKVLRSGQSFGREPLSWVALMKTC